MNIPDMTVGIYDMHVVVEALPVYLHRDHTLFSGKDTTEKDFNTMNGVWPIKL